MPCVGHHLLFVRLRVPHVKHLFIHIYIYIYIYIKKNLSFQGGLLYIHKCMHIGLSAHRILISISLSYDRLCYTAYCRIGYCIIYVWPLALLRTSPNSTSCALPFPFCLTVYSLFAQGQSDKDLCPFYDCGHVPHSYLWGAQQNGIMGNRHILLTCLNIHVDETLYLYMDIYIYMYIYIHAL